MSPFSIGMPRWRNGRRGGLKIRFSRESGGSSPFLGTRCLRKNMEGVMSSKNLIGWALIIGPLSAFLFGGLLTGILIGPGETAAEAVSEMQAKIGLKSVFTILGSLGFVFAFIGTVLLSNSMRGDGKPGSLLASISTVIFIALTTLAMAATMSDWAALGSLQNDNLDAAAQISNAVTITLVGNALWAGLFFFWGIGFLTLGTALVMQRKLNVIVDWIFVVFGALFVILLLMPWDLAQNVGFLIFGVMVLNTIAAGVFQLRADES